MSMSTSPTAEEWEEWKARVREQLAIEQAERECQKAERKAKRSEETRKRRAIKHQLYLHRTSTVTSGVYPEFGVTYLDKGGRMWQKTQKERKERWKEERDARDDG